MYHIRELDGIPDEKHGKIISDQVVVALLSIELDGKAPGVSNRICRAPPSSDSRKPYKHRGLHCWILKKFRLGIRLHTPVNLEIAMGPCSFGMDNPFGNAFPVKMSHLLNKLDIL